MSNTSLILTAIEDRITALATGRKKLKYSYDLEKNDSRSSDDAYGLGSGAATLDTGGVNKSVTMDQDFFVVLSENYINRSGDSKESEAINKIYNDLETITTDLINSKLGIAAVVLVVQSVGLDAPEKISEKSITVKANFVIKHRKATT